MSNNDSLFNDTLCDLLFEHIADACDKEFKTSRKESPMPKHSIPWFQRIAWSSVPSGRSRPPFQVACILITPEMAEEMLATSTNYRNPDRGRCEKYMALMAEGLWELNGESLKFDTSYMNIDGQHRLRACIKSGESFQSFVICGLTDSLEVDRGKPRNVNDALKAEGYNSVCNLGASIAACWCYETFGSLVPTTVDHYPSCNEALSYIKRNPHLVVATRIAQRARGLLRVSIMAPVIYQGCLLQGLPDNDAEKLMDDFVSGVTSGVEGNFRDARHQLHSRLASNKMSRTKLLTLDLCAITIKAWNRFSAGLSTEPGTLRWRTTGERPEEFPQLVTAKDIAR